MGTKITATRVQKHGKTLWMVDLPASEAGRRRRIFAASREAAVARAQKIIAERLEFGREMSELTAEERAFVLRWRGRLSVAEMERTLASAPVRSAMTVSEAAAEYLASLDGTDGYLRSVRWRLRAICAEFGVRRVADFSRGELQSHVDSRGASALNWFILLRAFFNFCEFREWISASPMKRVAAPHRVNRGKRVLSAGSLRRLLQWTLAARAARNGCAPEADEIASEEAREALARYLVFGAFFGLRTSEILRLRGESILDEEIYIDRMKTQKRGLRDRFVAILPNAREWLGELELPKRGRLFRADESRLSRYRRHAIRACAIEDWFDNCLRKSFGSAHLAAFANADLTAAQMGHTSAELTFAKYRAAIPKAQGEAWFAITPESVMGG